MSSGSRRAAVASFPSYPHRLVADEKINLAAVPVHESRSPKGRFRQFSREVLTAMRQTNGDRMTGVQFPFDIRLISLPPRAASGPYRSHSARWVYYQIISGRGVVRTPGGVTEVREGDCIMHPPGEAHQLLNTGAADLIYHFITDNPPADACYFPDSNKWSLPGHANRYAFSRRNFTTGRSDFGQVAGGKES